MKKILTGVLVLGLLVLDWAALDDITTGKESDYFLEYFILLLSGLIFVILGLLFLKKKFSF